MFNIIAQNNQMQIIFCKGKGIAHQKTILKGKLNNFLAILMKN